jgi:hypothetical protein
MPEYPQTNANLGETERLFSLVGGGLALLAALRRPTLSTLPLAMGGGYLLYRGLARQDPIYEALNIRRSEDGDTLLVGKRSTSTAHVPRSTPSGAISPTCRALCSIYSLLRFRATADAPTGSRAPR